MQQLSSRTIRSVPASHRNTTLTRAAPAHHLDSHTHPHPRPAALSAEQRLRVIGDVGRTLSSILEPQELLERVTELVTHRFDYYYSLILLCEDEHLVIRSAHGRDHGTDQRLLGRRCLVGQHGITGWAAAEERTVIVPDVQAEPRFVCVDEIQDVRSALAVPLLGRERLIGVLEVESDRLDDFHEEDAGLLETLAAQLAIVIENAELLQAERERARRLATVTEIARKVTSILDLQELLDHTTALIAERFQYYSVGIMLRDTGDERWLDWVAGNPGVPHGPPGSRVRVGEGMTGWAVETGQTQLARDTDLDPHFIQGPGFRARAELDAPLKAGGGVLGVLCIQSERPDAFGEDDVPFVETLADQIAVAIENARLLERTRDLAASEERNRLAREIHDTLAQSLAALTLDLDAAQKLAVEDSGELGALLARTRELAHRALEEARHAISSLRPETLTEVPLTEALAAEVASLEQSGAVHSAEFVVEGERRQLAPEVEAALFRIAQEALTNVRKHARAKRVRAVLSFEGQAVSLLIQDDGVGFDPHTPPTAKAGFGLTSMRQRAGLIGSQIEIDSSAGWGTRIRVHVGDAVSGALPAATAPIRVMLVDDHALVREGVRRMLEVMPRVVVAAEATDGEEAVARAVELQPQVVLMDVQMPGLDGLQATRRIRARVPDVRVIMLSTTAPDDVVLESVRAGARGYLLKDVGADDLRRAIQSVAEGGSFFSPAAAAKLAGGVRRAGPEAERLTPRELAVLRQLAAGLSNKAIAAKLQIGENTVQTHLRHIYAKLDVGSRTEALRRASERGILAL